MGFFSPCLPGRAIWVSQHPPPADILSCLAERCSRTGAFRDPGYQTCVPAAANGDPWVLAGDPHSGREIVLTARSAPIPLCRARSAALYSASPAAAGRGGSGEVPGCAPAPPEPRLRAQPGRGTSPVGGELPGRRADSQSRGCVGQRLCPMGRRRGRFLRCLHPTSASQEASLKPSSSRTRKAAKPNRCASLCRENTAATQSVPAREREPTGSRAPRVLIPHQGRPEAFVLGGVLTVLLYGL